MSGRMIFQSIDIAHKFSYDSRPYDSDARSSSRRVAGAASRLLWSRIMPASGVSRSFIPLSPPLIPSPARPNPRTIGAPRAAAPAPWATPCGRGDAAIRGLPYGLALLWQERSCHIHETSVADLVDIWTRPAAQPWISPRRRFGTSVPALRLDPVDPQARFSIASCGCGQ